MDEGGNEGFGELDAPVNVLTVPEDRLDALIEEDEEDGAPVEEEATVVHHFLSAAAVVAYFIGRGARALVFWRSPADQPRWARPSLLAVAALAGLSYAWGISNYPLEPFYAAAARSMGSSWRDFFFGAVDPWGTVTLDKLPGAFWVQALFVRVLGFHYWVVALPQVLAGILTVLVLYRAVRRLAGPKAGIVAALIVAASPASALVNRGNISDSMLVLLTVLAADATAAAVTSGRLRTLLLAGVWVGLAFQTKMLQAWLIVPALLLTYVVAAPPALRRRLGHAAMAGLVVVVVSLSWMTIVTAIPAHDRPYVDGTNDNSVYVQVFVYNGWKRVGISLDADKIAHPAAPFLTVNTKNALNGNTLKLHPSWDRLLTGALGRDDGWLLPVALLSAAAVLVARRKAGRRDRTRAGVVMWAGWLVTLYAFFSVGSYINSYYTAALIPAVAALCAIGLSVAWRCRSWSRISRALLLVVVPAVTVYTVALIPSGAGVRWWLVPLAAVACIAAEVAMVSSLRNFEPGLSGGAFAFGLASISLLVVPAVTTGVVVYDGLGSFSTPYQSYATTVATTLKPERYQSEGLAISSFYNQNFPRSAIVNVDDTGALASPTIMVTGREFLPIGGYFGANPSPTLSRLEQLVRTGQARMFDIPLTPPGKDPRLAWVRSNCDLVEVEPYEPHVRIGRYDCAFPPHGFPTAHPPSAVPSQSAQDGGSGLIPIGPEVGQLEPEGPSLSQSQLFDDTATDWVEAWDEGG